MSENRENGYSQEEEDIVSLIDQQGRELLCYVEEYIELEDDEYLVLLPVDASVDIFIGDPEAEELSVVQDEATIKEIFGSAKAVLAEKNLKLKTTPFVLTVEGELPPVDEENLLTLEIQDEDANPMQPPVEPEELQLLANFRHENKDYSIYTPLAPLVFFGRFNDEGKAELLSEEEYERVRPLLEEQLFNQME
ncbi:DUF3727 domain-containing protein [Phormidium sp. LEGE 05292]|uniref:DUF3727 domain-containing protein n=1 Tax=[Phormidium] sp. LEGE 05292 TaxID=767427 RepID=UPI00187F93D4|nr:DUF3727 domain-containing protein [Phormidium sp. LEGE 05292]MBE9226559.1 DUF3727 domain-containing protein [Phormidium sp. LEGE 05292]